jgi:hypothetical protein
MNLKDFEVAPVATARSVALVSPLFAADTHEIAVSPLFAALTKIGVGVPLAIF